MCDLLPRVGKLVQVGGEPLTEEQKESVKKIIDRYWSEKREDNKGEEMKNRQTGNETFHDNRLLRPVRRPKPKAEPRNRPHYVELRIAYGKIADARNHILRAMAYIDPLDKRANARVLPDLDMAYALLDAFLERKLREPIPKAVLDELLKSARDEE